MDEIDSVIEKRSHSTDTGPSTTDALTTSKASAVVAPDKNNGGKKGAKIDSKMDNKKVVQEGYSVCKIYSSGKYNSYSQTDFLKSNVSGDFFTGTGTRSEQQYFSNKLKQ